MKKITTTILTSLILTAGILTSIGYYGKDIINSIGNINKWEEIELGGVVEIPENDMGEIVEEVDEEGIVETENLEQEAEDLVEEVVEEVVEEEDDKKDQVEQEELKNELQDEDQQHQSPGNTEIIEQKDEESNSEAGSSAISNTNQEENVVKNETETHEIIVNNDPNKVTVVYNANGGYFSNNALEKTVTYQKDDNTNKYVASENIQFPNKAANGDTKYMFAGWYLESGEPMNQTNEWYTQDVELEAVGLGNTKTVYARWLEFEDLPIEIGGKVVATIMDRNLGAEARADGIYYESDQGHEDYSKLGFYYQWGNNYGFKNNGELPFSDITDSNNNNRVDADDYGPNNYYSNSTFKKIQSSPSVWTINNNLNLWGGENSDNPDTDKQGPCPAGYHVPDKGEWESIYKFFKNEKTSNKEYCAGFGVGEEGKCFASKLRLPFAGIRSSYSSSVYNQGNYGYYWSSFPFKDLGDDTHYPSAYRIEMDSDSAGTHGGNFELANGFSVRCFKDSLPNTLTLHIDKEESQEIEVRWRELADKLKSLDLSKVGKFIIGWYKDREFTEERDIWNDVVKYDMTLYAKRVDGGIEYLEGQGMIKVYAGDMEYYIKDRNVGVDENEDVKGKTKKIVDCMFLGADDCGENVFNGFTRDIGGNIYYWGNNSGINVKDIETDDSYKVISDLPEWFNGGNWDNDGWLEGNSDNPCNGNGEYLPSIDDRLNVMKIYGSMKGYELSYELGAGWFNYLFPDDEEYILEIISDILLSGIGNPGLMLYNDSDGRHLYPDPYGYSFTAKDDKGNIGVHMAHFLAGTAFQGTLDESIYNELFGAAIPVRCFVNPIETFNVEFNSNGGSAVESQSVSSGDNAEVPNNPRLEGKVFDGWYTDTTLKNEFDFSTPITSNLILYAKWVEGGIEYLKDKRMIRIYAGDKEYYIRDRNVGVDNDVDVQEKTNRFRGCLLGELNEEECSIEDAKAVFKSLGGNAYFWGNNIGINAKDSEIDDDFNIIFHSIPEEFGRGRVGEKNTGWGEGENNNPCNENGEYFPTLNDWVDVLRIYGSLNGFDLISDYGDTYLYYELNIDDEYDFFEMAKHLILHPSLMIQYDSESNRYISNLESATLVQSWVSNSSDLDFGYTYQYFVGGEKNGEEEDYDGVNNVALPVRCFVHPQNDSTSHEETVPPISYSGGGGRTPANITTTKEHNSADKEKQTEATDKKQETVDKEKTNKPTTLYERLLQQKQSNTTQTKGPTSTQSLSTYYNHISTEDNAAYTWARENNITTMEPNEANPNGYVNRGEMAKMVVNFAMNVLGEKLPEKYPQCKWEDDVNDWDSKELKGYATKACALGLMGINTEYFNPKKEVTRAQFGTILSRMLWGNDFNIKDTKDKPYYTDHLRALKANGIMDIIVNADKTKEVRKRIWLMMKRTVENK